MSDIPTDESVALATELAANYHWDWPTGMQTNRGIVVSSDETMVWIAIDTDFIVTAKPHGDGIVPWLEKSSTKGCIRDMLYAWCCALWGVRNENNGRTFVEVHAPEDDGGPWTLIAGQYETGKNNSRVLRHAFQSSATHEGICLGKAMLYAFDETSIRDRGPVQHG